MTSFLVSIYVTGDMYIWAANIYKYNFSIVENKKTE